MRFRSRCGAGVLPRLSGAMAAPDEPRLAARAVDLRISQCSVRYAHGRCRGFVGPAWDRHPVPRGAERIGAVAHGRVSRGTVPTDVCSMFARCRPDGLHRKTGLPPTAWTASQGGRRAWRSSSKWTGRSPTADGPSPAGRRRSRNPVCRCRPGDARTPAPTAGPGVGAAQPTARGRSRGNTPPHRPHAAGTEIPGRHSPVPEPGAAVRRINSLSAAMASSWRLSCCAMASRCCAMASPWRLSSASRCCVRACLRSSFERTMARGSRTISPPQRCKRPRRWQGG